MTSLNTYLFYLAGLLRPLGIHYGRLETDLTESRDAAGFSKQEDSGNYILHSVRFIDQHSEVFDRLGTGTARQLTELLLASASGESQEGRLLALADRLAAGGPVATGVGPLKPLGSVYGMLLSRSHSDSFHRPVVLEADKRIFPEIGDWSSGAPGDVTFSEFIKEFKALRRGAPEVFCECLTALIRKYFSFNWAGWNHLPEVSLYERCRLTSAFAAVLADSDEPVDAGRFLLVGGDLSGIQDYLYDIVGREAYKNLKGRSFYLHLLANGVLERLLQRLGLLSVHVIYVSGGGFYVMAPDSNRNRETVDAFRQELERIMFRKHRNNLYFSLAAVPFTGTDILDQRTAEAWTGLAHELADLKRRRFATQLQQDYSVFFEPFEAGGLQQRDLITGDEIEGNSVRYLDDDRDKPVSPDTYQQIELGRLLRNDIGYWISSDDTSRAIKAYRTFTIEDGLPTSIFPLNEQLGGIIPTLPEKSRVRLINTSKFPEALLNGYHGSIDVEFYGGSEIPRNRDESPKTFEELAGVEGKEAGFRRLGYLRMDVDNLGRVFINGFDKSNRPFVRYSALSHSLDLFFRGYLNHLWSQDPEFRSCINIVYAGGDDLFAVGRWDVMIRFAKSVRDAFGEYTGRHPDLGLSGGLVLVSDKFPIAKAALLAEDAEKQAKGHSFHGRAKDSITLFDHPLSWKGEFELVQLLREKLFHLITDRKLPQGFLRTLLQYEQIALEQKRSGQNPSWRWHIAYQFSRMAGRFEDAEIKNFLHDLKNGLFTERCDMTAGLDYKHDRYAFIELAAISARLAEFDLRTNE